MTGESDRSDPSRLDVWLLKDVSSHRNALRVIFDDRFRRFASGFRRAAAAHSRQAGEQYFVNDRFVFLIGSPQITQTRLALTSARDSAAKLLK